MPAPALFAAAAAVFVWGGTPVATKIGVAAVDPIVVGVLRTALAALVTVPIMLLARMARPTTRRQFLALAVSALGGFVVFPILFSVGVRHTSASHGALLLAALPVLTGLFAAVVERRIPAWTWWFGASIAIAGEVALVGFRFGLTGVEDGLVGDLIVAASCVAASIGYVAGGRLAREIGAWPTTLWGISLATVVLAPFLPGMVRDVAWRTLGAPGLLAIAYLAFLSSIVAYVAWYWALATGGIGRVGTLQFAQPVVGLVLAAVILGEPLTVPLVLTASTILVGIWIAQRG